MQVRAPLCGFSSCISSPVGVIWIGALDSASALTTFFLYVKWSSRSLSLRVQEGKLPRAQQRDESFVVCLYLWSSSVKVESAIENQITATGGIIRAAVCDGKTVFYLQHPAEW